MVRRGRKERMCSSNESIRIMSNLQRSGKKRSEQKVEKEVTAMKFGCREEERDTRASAGRYGIKEGV